MNTIGKRYGILAVCSALLIALDQWAKSMAYSTLRVNGPLVLIKGVFELLYSENRGAAFGILQGKQWFFFLVAAAVVIAVLVFVAKLPSGKPVPASLYRHGPSPFRSCRKPDRPCGDGGSWWISSTSASSTSRFLTWRTATWSARPDF